MTNEQIETQRAALWSKVFAALIASREFASARDLADIAVVAFDARFNPANPSYGSDTFKLSDVGGTADRNVSRNAQRNVTG